ncbi:MULTISPECIES: BACON domain-containing protein [Maribacter]|uniref:BACON domain-containing protein n=1 Tax=Maribacter flavus TaxID=1658664 RepID=A0A5B2TWJ7_9FLAO|nr:MULTISPECIES: hypothetical protein [Maribacter]KAA2218165.1 hypothetical protein F0361_00675 [Maribacter flavus]MDC6405118.1 hypothetical protein [Maribacter sp. PR66]MEE1972531.1 hypothetical protein [Maribacter flavus]
MGKSKPFFAIKFLCGIFFLLSCSNENDSDIGKDLQLIVSPNNLELLQGESGTIFISSQPEGRLEWRIGSKPNWISFSPSSGILDGTIDEILVTTEVSGLNVGWNTGSVEIISSSAGKKLMDVSVFIETPQISQMAISKSILEFDYQEDSTEFYIKNSGGLDFNWTINNQNDYLTVSPDSGFLAIGDSILVTSTVDRTELETNIYEYSLNIGNNQQNALELPVNIKAYKEEKWILDNGQIVDAEYDRNYDKIIAVSEFPNQILNINPVSQGIQSLDLNLPPTSVSISQDGNLAVVGHDGYISYINLSSMELIQMYSVTTDVFDIVLGPNNWAYAFPRVDQHERIRCIDLSTGNETQNTGNTIYAGTRAKLHPSGSYIYGADNGLSPSDFEKYDISGGTAHYLYDSPYHGDFEFSGNIWISESGDKLFSRARNVFNASENQTNDMTYSGKLLGEQGKRISTMDSHAEANVIYTIVDEGLWDWDYKPGGVVKKYTEDFYNFQGEIELPKFLGTDTNGNFSLFSSHGYFGFFNSAGSQFYVIVKADEENNSAVRWGISTITVD